MTERQTSQSRLNDSLQVLTREIEKLLSKPVDLGNTDDERAVHLTRLNDELKQENLLLKEQLFSAISSINSLKSKNKKIYTDIDEVVVSLERLLN